MRDAGRRRVVQERRRAAPAAPSGAAQAAAAGSSERARAGAAGRPWAAERARPAPQPRRGIRFDGEKVLIVDDDIRNVFALTSVLEQHGLPVLYAENGREGIEVLEQHDDVDARADGHHDARDGRLRDDRRRSAGCRSSPGCRSSR